MSGAAGRRARVHVRLRHLAVGAVLVGLVGLVGLVPAWSLLGARLPVGPCGLGVLRYDDRTWTVVHGENSSQQQEPRHRKGLGIVTSAGEDRLTFGDVSGATLTFVPGSANPTGCA
ncbi:MAG: hypothetical protein ACRYG2_08815 [Janthinobacterium lividum]